MSPMAEVASKPQTRTAEEVKDERPRLDSKDRRWANVHAAAKKRMDFANPSKRIKCFPPAFVILITLLVVSANQNKIHEILRVFDLYVSFAWGISELCLTSSGQVIRVWSLRRCIPA